MVQVVQIEQAGTDYGVIWRLERGPVFCLAATTSTGSAKPTQNLGPHRSNCHSASFDLDLTGKRVAGSSPHRVGSPIRRVPGSAARGRAFCSPVRLLLHRERIVWLVTHITRSNAREVHPALYPNVITPATHRRGEEGEFSTKGPFRVQGSARAVHNPLPS